MRRATFQRWLSKRASGHHRRFASGLSVGILFGVLSACSSPPPQRPPEPIVARAPDYHRGLRIYQHYCAACHDGANVEAPPLDDIEAWDERSYEWQGLFRGHVARGFLRMPAAEELSEESINDALLYMETRIRALDEESRNESDEGLDVASRAGPG